MIPGLKHCGGGPGAWAFGQGSFLGRSSNKINDSDHNILLALVDWVEGGVAPSSITGVGEDMTERMHCMYPQKSVWSGTVWKCVSP
jgi:feruloyl esterase